MLFDFAIYSRHNCCSPEVFPSYGGQSQQFSVKGDEQEVIPAVQAGDVQPNPEISVEGRQTSSRGASDKQRINLAIILKGRTALL